MLVGVVAAAADYAEEVGGKTRPGFFVVDWPICVFVGEETGWKFVFYYYDGADEGADEPESADREPEALSVVVIGVSKEWDQKIEL